MSGTSTIEARVCPYRKKCGGCSDIGESYEKVLREKEARIRKMLAPFTELEGMEGMENPYHYRNKIHRVCSYERVGRKEFHLSGIYAEGTHRIVPVKSCLIEDERADAIIEDILKLARDFKIRNYSEDTGRGLLRHILIRTARATGQIMAVLVLADRELPGKKHFVKKLVELHPELTTVVINVNDRPGDMILGERESAAFGRGYIEDVLCGKRFRISARSFYQVNPAQTERIYEAAAGYAELGGNEVVIDAYCGIGTIGIACADRARMVTGIESNRGAVKDAAVNAKLNGIKNIRFIAEDAAAWMEKAAAAGARADVILMDPPRAGSTERFLGAAAQLRPKKIIYISCNPETLVRDLRYLKGRGYGAVRARAFDQFCWTSHAECVVCVEPVGR
ncbi:MAG: 23S rRNA (uracil(1939)-C(5))-methyltransferase RlmD [Lachnospiraceae bacterium]|nr:23S rRNA (uracil(1939)-C(5))-methyltransferase RlmD [Lachnospiraceae bacterium]